MITLIGTGHVFDLSAAVHHHLQQLQPNVVCMELDKPRYTSLVQRRNSPVAQRDTSSLPVVYRLLSRFQEGVAKEYGVNVGDEMLAADAYAHQHNVPIELIDMNAQQLFTHMWSSMSLLERARLFFGSIFGGLLVSRKRIEKELEDFQEHYDTYLDEIAQRFPTIKKVLIDDRNKYMADKLVKLNQKYDQVVALVGDGHIPGLTQLLEKEKVEVNTIRLKELQQHVSTTDSSGKSFSFSTEYDYLQ